MIQVSPTNTLAGLGAAGTNGLRDIKPPVEIPSIWSWLGWVLAALVLAVLGYVLGRYWQKKRSEIPPVPVIPAHVRARRKLQDALALIDRPKEFCILVSDTVRWYLEEQFRFRAPERTTEEFLYELRNTNLLTPDQKESLGEFLNRCDLVKFAKYEPREPELHDLHDSALRLVDETTPPEQAETADSQAVPNNSEPPAVASHPPSS